MSANDERLGFEPDASSIKQRSVRGAVATAAAQAVRVVLQVGSVIALGRLLSPGDFGLVAMVMPLVGFIQLFNEFGLTQAIVQRPEITQRQLSALFWTNLCISTGLALVVVFGAPLVAWLYGEPRVGPITTCLAVLLLLGGLAAQPTAVLNRQMRFVTLATIDSAAALAGVAVGIGAALLGCGYWSLAAMQVSNVTVALMLTWTLSGWRPHLPRREPDVGSFLRFGGNITGYNVVCYFSYSLDKVLIGAASGTVALGLYERTSRLMSTPMWQAILPVARVAVPLLCRLRDAPERYRNAYLWMVGAMLLSTTPGIACIVMLAEPVIVTLIGAQWREAAPVLTWMALGTLIVPVNISIGWLFVSQGRTREQLAWGTVCSAIMVVSFVAGLPWGPVGVAAASTIALYLFSTPLLWWAVSRNGPVCLRDLVGICWPFAVAGGASAAVLWVAERGLGPPIGARLGLAVLLCYSVGVLVLACLPAGKRFLREAWSLRSTLREMKVREPASPAVS